MKYIALTLAAVAVFAVSLVGILAATGNLNQDKLDRLLGRESGAPEKAAEETALPLDPIARQMQMREQSLSEKERELKEYEQQLNQRAAELDALYQQVQAAQQQLDAAIGAADEAREVELETVANTVANMKPKAAAERIENMPVDDIVEVLRKMKDKDRGKIVEAMSPETAAEVLRKMQAPVL